MPRFALPAAAAPAAGPPWPAELPPRDPFERVRQADPALSAPRTSLTKAPLEEAK